MEDRVKKTLEAIQKVLEENGTTLNVTVMLKPNAQIAEEAKPEPEEATE